jgi:hypothetical protein
MIGGIGGRRLTEALAGTGEAVQPLKQQPATTVEESGAAEIATAAPPKVSAAATTKANTERVRKADMMVLLSHRVDMRSIQIVTERP